MHIQYTGRIWQRKHSTHTQLTHCRQMFTLQVFPLTHPARVPHSCTVHIYMYNMEHNSTFTTIQCSNMNSLKIKQYMIVDTIGYWLNMIDRYK
jgi:hypothetical protein